MQKTEHRPAVLAVRKKLFTDLFNGLFFLNYAVGVTQMFKKKSPINRGSAKY
jgi:hypothetical protein